MNLKLAFSYPRRGLFGEFATFRFGRAAAAKYPPGSMVELIDSRSKKTLKLATVMSTHLGALNEMAPLHAHQAHNWKEYPRDEQAGLLIASMLKRYPPGSYCNTSICSVIYLKEIYEDQGK